MKNENPKKYLDAIGRIHSIETFGAIDGPGLRYIIFLQGCPLRCLFCHNPDTWKFKDGKLAKVSDLVNDVISYKSFLKSGGVTISGGEPLAQPEFTKSLIKAFKNENIHTAIDTAGALPLKNSKEILDAVDMVLLDIKTLDDDIAAELTSQSIENTLETLDYLQSINKRTWIRHVLVPGYTLNEKSLREVASYLKDFSCIERVELLPFHKMGEFKWAELGYDYKLLETKEPTKEEIRLAKSIFREYGFMME